MNVKFRDLKKGKLFKFNGEVFEKSAGTLAWALRDGRRYKEWAFDKTTYVKPIH